MLLGHSADKVVAKTLLFFLVAALQAQPIAPTLFGQNFWLADGDEGRVGYIQKLWPQIAASGVKIIRLGGNGYEKDMPSLSELEARIDSVKSIGAEPLIQVPRQYTAAETRALVTYFNVTKKNPIKYWAVGNEPLLHHEFTIEGIHEYILRIAPAIKQVDPTVKIFVFDECEIREKEYQALCGGDLDITGLKKNGAWLIDGFSFHKYPMGTEFVRDDVLHFGPDLMREQITTLIRMMKEADKKHRRKGKDALIWGLTEVNVTWSNPNREISGYGNPSFLGGQFIAEMYGLGMEFEAFTVSPWCIHEGDNIHTDFGYLGLPNNFYPRSSYYHTQIMSQNMRGEFVASANNHPNLKTVASRSKDEICVLVMNQDLVENLDFEIILNKNGDASASVQVNVDTRLKARFSNTIQNQSTQLYVFSVQGKLLRRIDYSLGDNLKFAAPRVVEFES